MPWVAGADGCRDGWCAVLRDTDSGSHSFRLVTKFSELFKLECKPVVIAVDIPIGLLEHGRKGGRACDKEARVLLGQPRARSVFSPPVRGALNYIDDFLAANKFNRSSSSEEVGISKQCFGLFKKLAEVDKWMTDDKQELIREVHPELCFFEMSGGRSMKHSKKKTVGLGERMELLRANGFAEFLSATIPNREKGCAVDDILDACAACWTAQRILERPLISIPADREIDNNGLFMEMWR